MQPISPSDQYLLSKVSDPQIAPDADRVAYVRTRPVSEEAYRSTIWTVPTDGGDPAPFTDPENDASETQPRWSPDGEHLAFVSARGDGKRSQVWVAPSDGGEAERITNVPGGVTDVSWSPDGDAIAFLQERAPEERESGQDLGMDDDYEEPEPSPRVIEGRLIHREEEGRHPTRTWKTWYDDARTHVYVVDVEDATVTRVSDGDFDCYSLDWGDADSIYYTAKPSTDDEVYHEVRRYDRTSGDTEAIAGYSHSEIWTPAVAASPDGMVAHTTMPSERPTSHQTDIEVIDEDTGETTVVTADLDHTISRNTTPHWDASGENLYFLTLSAGSVVLQRANVTEGSVEAVLGGDHDIEGPLTRSDVSLANGSVTYVQAGWEHLGDVVVAATDGSSVTRLTETNADVLSERAVSEPEEIWYESADGSFDVQGWVLHPPEFDPDETYPLVVGVHGGPHAMYSPNSKWLEYHAMAAAGYVVFWPNYRGSTGYGEAFQLANVPDWGGADYDDVMAGTDVLAERDYVDEENMFVTGGSYGGYMTGWILTQTDRFAAAVPKSGLYSLPTVYGNTDKFKFMEWEMGGTPLEDPDFYWERSPVAHAATATTPTMITVGDHDFATPFSDSELFYQYLTKAGVETQLISYPGEGHEILRDGRVPRHAADRIERTIDWFETHRTDENE